MQDFKVPKRNQEKWDYIMREYMRTFDNYNPYEDSLLIEDSIIKIEKAIYPVKLKKTSYDKIKSLLNSEDAKNVKERTNKIIKSLKNTFKLIIKYNKGKLKLSKQEKEDAQYLGMSELKYAIFIQALSEYHSKKFNK